MSHALAVNPYTMLENSTLGWPIPTTNFPLSPSTVNQTQIEETEEKVTVLKSKVSSLEREKQSFERVALQIQRSFLEIYKISDQLMGELLTENPSQEKVNRLIRERKTFIESLRNGSIIAPENQSVADQIMGSLYTSEEDLHGDITRFFGCRTTNRNVLCENYKILDIYQLHSAVEELIYEKINIITNKIDFHKKGIKAERKNPVFSKKALLEKDVRKLKAKIKKQEEEREDIQKAAWKIQELLKKSCFISHILIHHILSEPDYEKVNSLIQERSSFRHFLLTQVKKLIPEEQEEAIRKIEEEEPQARTILYRNPNKACRYENRRTTLFHQLASEIERKSSQKIDSINEKIKDLKERVKLLRTRPEQTVSSTKVLFIATLISSGLSVGGGVVALSLTVAGIAGYIWLKQKSKTPQNEQPTTLV